MGMDASTVILLVGFEDMDAVDDMIPDLLFDCHVIISPCDGDCSALYEWVHLLGSHKILFTINANSSKISINNIVCCAGRWNKIVFIMCTTFADVTPELRSCSNQIMYATPSITFRSTKSRELITPI